MNLDMAFIIGSKTDSPIVDESKMLEVWNQYEMNWILDIISADRNPMALKDRCDQLLKRRVKVIAAAAGMAARLPGTVASYLRYMLPVIGIALPSPEFPDALDSTFSIARPPAGCPVGFAGARIRGLRNAAIFIAQMLTNRPESQLVSIVTGSKSDYRAIEEAEMINVLTRCKVNWEHLTWRQGDLSDYCQGMVERKVRICITSLRITNSFKEKLIFPNFSPLMISLPLPSDGFSNAKKALEALAEPPEDWPVVSTGIGKAGLRNAALFTVQILATGDNKKGKEIKDRLTGYFNTTRKEPQLAYRKSQKKGGVR